MHGRAHRRLRVLPGVHRHPEGRHRADHEGPRAGRHRGRVDDWSTRQPPSRCDRSPAAPLRCSTARCAGDRAALARLLSLVERGGDDAGRAGRARPPGRRPRPTRSASPARRAPASRRSRTRCSPCSGDGDATVAVLAIDPSSPFTGGAILGDRVRMSDHATRRRRVHPLDGHPRPPRRAVAGHARGGAGARRRRARRGCSIETVGVGQVEVEVAGSADTTVVVVNPGWGDAVQANKAGLMEIADVFVINKADRPGAAETGRDLGRCSTCPTRPAAGARRSSRRWPPTARRADLWAAIERASCRDRRCPASWSAGACAPDWSPSCTRSSGVGWRHWRDKSIGDAAGEPPRPTWPLPGWPRPPPPRRSSPGSGGADSPTLRREAAADRRGRRGSRPVPRRHRARRVPLQRRTPRAGGTAPRRGTGCRWSSAGSGCPRGRRRAGRRAPRRTGSIRCGRSVASPTVVAVAVGVRDGQQRSGLGGASPALPPGAGRSGSGVRSMRAADLEAGEVGGLAQGREAARGVAGGVDADHGPAAPAEQLDEAEVLAAAAVGDVEVVVGQGRT